ncbi:hypothetical protein FRC12_015113 [Ceratobasidium sp. 428]|nr:hypothetical protein FRC12_015113 [Ceratobasidium sp. 428]
MDPTWPPLHKLIMEQKADAIAKVEPRLVTGAGRGLFATMEIDPLQTLVSIPGCLLLNTKTLGKAYPHRMLPQKSSEDAPKDMPLTSTQLISLHLYRWRRGVSDPIFEAYIHSLPNAFPDHPLTIIIFHKTKNSILDLLPTSVAKLLIGVKKRLTDDWDMITKTLKKFPELLPPLDLGSNWDKRLHFADFVWAWLNVNTRCLYHDLGLLRSEDNITMCPLLDFANHTPLQSMSITQDGFALCDGMAFSSSTHLQPGEEVYLRYGGHSNALLFAEYGFVFPTNTGDARAEISIDSDVEELLKSCGDYEAKAQLLKDRNYWGDWTLHVEDGIGRPSFRLLPALRLLHVPSLAPVPNRSLELWENTLLGLVDVVSTENESQVRSSMKTLCKRIIDRSALKISLVQFQISVNGHGAGDRDKDYLQVLRMAKILWEEEGQVAELVENSIVGGVQF